MDCMTKISFTVPDGLHRRFKAACAMNDVTMKDVLEELMQGYVKEHGGKHD